MPQDSPKNFRVILTYHQEHYFYMYRKGMVGRWTQLSKEIYIDLKQEGKEKLRTWINNVDIYYKELA